MLGLVEPQQTSVGDTLTLRLSGTDLDKSKGVENTPLSLALKQDLQTQQAAMALTSPNTFQGVLLGSKSAGKSTILKCGLQGEPFVEGGCAPTYGPECLTMQSPVPPQAGDKSGTPPSQLTVLIWDCPGSEQFALSAMQYLRSQTASSSWPTHRMPSRCKAP